MRPVGSLFLRGLCLSGRYVPSDSDCEARTQPRDNPASVRRLEEKTDKTRQDKTRKSNRAIDFRGTVLPLLHIGIILAAEKQVAGQSRS